MRWLLFTITLAALTTAQNNCQNPLFNGDNWSASLPKYLETTEKADDTVSICGIEKGKDTCCNSKTIEEIKKQYTKGRAEAIQLGNFIEGIIRDTFNDFDPANQDSASTPSQPPNTSTTTVDQGVQGSSQGGTQSSPPPEGQGGNTSTTAPPGANPPGPNDFEDAQPMPMPQPDGPPPPTSYGPPPKDERPPGFDNVQVEEEQIVNPDPPKGRGHHKPRLYIGEMSEEGKKALEKIIRTMSKLMMQFAHHMGKCILSNLEHSMGMLCLGCYPDWEPFVNKVSGGINVNLKEEICTDLVANCKTFITQGAGIPKLVEEMKTAIDKVFQSEVSAGNLKASDVSTQDLSSVSKKPSEVANPCETDEKCRQFVCYDMNKGENGVTPDKTKMTDPANIRTGEGRLLSSAVSYNYQSNGFNSIAKGKAGEAAVAATTGTSSEALIDGVDSQNAPLEEDNSYASYLLASLLLYLSLL